MQQTWLLHLKWLSDIDYEWKGLGLHLPIPDKVERDINVLLDSIR